METQRKSTKSNQNNTVDGKHIKNRTTYARREKSVRLPQPLLLQPMPHKFILNCFISHFGHTIPSFILYWLCSLAQASSYFLTHSHFFFFLALSLSLYFPSTTHSIKYLLNCSSAITTVATFYFYTCNSITVTVFAMHFLSFDGFSIHYVRVSIFSFCVCVCVPLTRCTVDFVFQYFYLGSLYHRLRRTHFIHSTFVSAY